MKLCYFVLLVLIFGFFVLLNGAAAQPPMLEITTQGFSAKQPQKGVIGEYPRLRVRIEAANRIKELVIRERSYEVDLASTRDKSNLHLFGLGQNPRSYPDVTLNLQKYINEKIASAGEYEFHIRVKDKDGNSAEQKFSVLVQEARPAGDFGMDENDVQLHTGIFTLERVGAQPVKGGRQFGIYWKNRDNANVKILIIREEDSNTRLCRLDRSDFDSLQTREQLAERVAGLENTEAVILTAGRDRAAGEVFWVCHEDTHYLLKVMESSAFPSADGTVVRLKGYYKY